MRRIQWWIRPGPSLKMIFGTQTDGRGSRGERKGMVQTDIEGERVRKKAVQQILDQKRDEMVKKIYCEDKGR